MGFIAGFAAIIAGLIMLVRQGGALLNARRTGVLVSKSYGAARIERAVDPERFERFLRQRRKGLAAPAIAILAGTGWLAWNFLALAAQG